MDPDAFPQLPEQPAAALAAGHSCYRCRKCRQLLATSAHVMPVEAAMGAWSGGGRSGGGGAGVWRNGCVVVG